jgi:hypothetical protein
MRIINLFSTLQGKWGFFRTLSDRATDTSMGTVFGHVTFTPIKPNVLHYKEEGEFTTAPGQKLSAYREYLYTLNSERNKIEKHYVNNGEDESLFYVLQFQSSPSAKAKIISATGHHLCARDQYKATYEFSVNENPELLSQFRLRYEVIGPQKNYVSDTTFEKRS